MMALEETGLGTQSKYHPYHNSLILGRDTGLFREAGRELWSALNLFSMDTVSVSREWHESRKKGSLIKSTTSELKEEKSAEAEKVRWDALKFSEEKSAEINEESKTEEINKWQACRDNKWQGEQI